MAEFSSPITGGLIGKRSKVSYYSFLNRPQQETQDLGNSLALQQNNIAIQNISTSLNNVSAQVNTLSLSLQSISEQIKQTSSLEDIKDRQKERQENILAEQQIREGKESIVERRIQTSLAEPVKKVGEKTQFTLGRLGNFFTILLGGFLGGVAIKTIGALVSGNKDKLDELKKIFLDNIGIVSGIFLAINGGFGAVLNIVSRLTARLGGSIFKNLLLRPVNALLQLVRSAAGSLVGGITPKANNLAPAASNNKSSAEPKNTGNGFGKNATIFAALYQGANDVFSGESIGKTLAGTAGVGALGAASMLLTKNPIFITASLLFGSDAAANYAKNLYEQSGIEKAIPDLSGEAKGSIFGMFQKPEDKVDFEKQQSSLPDLKEPDTGGNVTIFNNQNPSNGIGGGEISVPSAVGEANSLPSISSFNPNNFYVLYSQIQYNVVG